MKEFIFNLSDKTKKDVADALVLLEQGQSLAMPLSRNLAGIYPGLHELRLKDQAGQVRILYFIKKGDAIYFLHAFRKKTRELPTKEIDLVLKRLKEV
ncbi:MAG: type II toxin-antitoxin system RelE/ParE family toxin [Nitrospinae bacterium]|nr:type II toxin-antitoxin system RelE/ParE family toxin [Nitrospinota bacterium]